MKERLE